MFCTNCGSRLQNNAIFCGNCGSKVLIIEGEVNFESNSEYSENEISQIQYSKNQNFENQYVNEDSTTYEQKSSSTTNNTNYNYNQSSNTDKHSNMNQSKGNYSNSFDTTFINETIDYIKNLFVNPIGALNRIHIMSLTSTGTIAALSLIITLLSLNLFFKDSMFLYFIDNGPVILSLFIYCLLLSTALFVCSITIVNQKASWITLLKLTIITSLFFSIGSFISLIFISFSIPITIGFFCLTLIVIILMTYEGFLRITSTTIKNAKISLITSYCIIAVLSYLFIYINM